MPVSMTAIREPAPVYPAAQAPGEPIISEEVDIFGSAVPVDTTSGRYWVSNTTFSTPGRASILEICPYSTLTDRIFAARVRFQTMSGAFPVAVSMRAATSSCSCRRLRR